MSYVTVILGPLGSGHVPDPFPLMVHDTQPHETNRTVNLSQTLILKAPAKNASHFIEMNMIPWRYAVHVTFHTPATHKSDLEWMSDKASSMNSDFSSSVRVLTWRDARNCFNSRSDICRISSSVKCLSGSIFSMKCFKSRNS